MSTSLARDGKLHTLGLGSRAWSCICLLAPLLLASGCAPTPARQLNEARAALESARSVEADIYSSEAFHSAAAALKQAEAELAAQDRKSFFSRRYDRADRLLREAQSRAKEAVAAAADNRESARMAAQSAESEAQRSIDAATKRLRSVRKLPGEEPDLLAGDLSNAEESLREARLAYTQGRFMDALNHFLAADEKAKAVFAELKPFPRTNSPTGP